MMQADPSETEDAGKLLLGSDYDQVQCLTHAEVALMLGLSKKKKEAAQLEISQTFSKTQAHVKRYGSAIGDEQV
jgi:hypothetical protein